MELKQLQSALEAVLFAYAEPLSGAKLAEILDVEEALVEKLLVSLRDACDCEERGIQVIRLDGAWQLATKAAHGEVVKKALDTRRNTPLSPAALEVLAIIAYNQPVSRSFIEQVRGVDSSSSMSTLAEKGLIAEAGRLDLPGKPIAFKTTDAFLRTFGLSSLSELPPLHVEAEAQQDEAALYALPEELVGTEAGEELAGEAAGAEMANDAPDAAPVVEAAGELAGDAQAAEGAAREALADGKSTAEAAAREALAGGEAAAGDAMANAAAGEIAVATEVFAEEAFVMDEDEDDDTTRAIRGGAFIEGEGGAAALIGEDE